MQLIQTEGTSNVNKLTQPGWQEAAHGTGTPDIFGIWPLLEADVNSFLC